MKSYTDLNQSKKLAEILPLESADMYYCYGMNIHTKGWSFDSTPTIIDNSNRIDIHADIPCWSLTALLDVLKEGALDFANSRFRVYSNGVTKYMDNPIDACYEMILRLNELNLL